jgi:hypothetical protein
VARVCQNIQAGVVLSTVAGEIYLFTNKIVKRDFRD